jgi:hypothetical protein
MVVCLWTYTDIFVTQDTTSGSPRKRGTELLPMIIYGKEPQVRETCRPPTRCLGTDQDVVVEKKTRKPSTFHCSLPCERLGSFRKRRAYCGSSSSRDPQNSRGEEQRLTLYSRILALLVRKVRTALWSAGQYVLRAMTLVEAFCGFFYGRLQCRFRGVVDR